MRRCVDLLCIKTERLVAVGMTEKVKEFKAMGSNIYHSKLSEGEKEHH